MVYDPNIPEGTDLLSDSQVDIQENFSKANEFFGTDHITFNAVSDNGKHNKSTYVEQTVDPNTAANEVAIFSKEIDSKTRTFFRQEINGTIFQLSGPDPVDVQDSGVTFLPGNLLLKWGRFEFPNASTSVVVNFEASAPFSAVVFSVTLTSINDVSRFYAANVLTDTSFTGVRNTGGAVVDVMYMAIGRGPV